MEYSGRGDPIRSLSLLWRTPDQPDKPGRGPKPALTVDRIVQTAIAVADAEGLTAVSMRRVATELGAGAMSLYRYVPSKAELLDLMLDTVLAERATPDLTSGDWRANLERIAREDWAHFHRHPWVLQVAKGRPLLGPNEIAAFETVLVSIKDIGLSEREMVATVTLLGEYVEGAARVHVETARAAKETGVSDEQWWSDRTWFWEKLFDPARFPTIAAIYATGAFDDPLDPFEFGLQRVLDGIEATVLFRTVQRVPGESE
jgi:AcrR family transcriptional regulator